MEIITNNKPRHIIYGFELSDKEKEQFNYLDDIDQCSFFRYKGEYMTLGNLCGLIKSQLRILNDQDGKTGMVTVATAIFLVYWCGILQIMKL